MEKHGSLKKVYYVSFFTMVVIPVLLVFFISLSVIRTMMQNSAVSAIQSAQKTVVNSLSERVRDASLQLSHFVYVNNSELMELAAMTDTEDASQRYHYTTQLDHLFQVAMAPKQAVVSGMIYMKNGKRTYLKQELAIPEEMVKASGWYRKALTEKNMVSVGSYDTAETKVTLTSMKRSEMLLAVALSPDIGTDRSDKIDAVVLVFQTEIGEMIHGLEKNTRLGTMAVVSKDGDILFGNRMDTRLKACLTMIPIKEDGAYRLRVREDEKGAKIPYTSVITKIPDTEWYIISCVSTGRLTGNFNQIASIILVVTSGLFLLYYLFSRFFLRNIIVPVHTMVEGLKRVEEGDLDTHIAPSGQYEIRAMIHSFNQTVRQLKASVSARELAQQKKLEAEVRALQSQINPHFLVNTLNSIRFMAKVSKFEGIRKMAESLINILTCSFRSNSSFYTVGEELEVLDSYLYLMKIRYSDGFDVEYQIEEDCRALKMPRLVLQPVVENSIVHGFTEMDEELGHLMIRVYKDEETLFLEVKDNGRGMSEEEIKRVLNPKERDIANNYNIGIENVYSRLKLYFSQYCGLTIESELGRYTKTVISLPIEHSVKIESEEQA